jgi:hypothetical protein
MSGMGSITVHVPLAVRPRPGRKTIVNPAGSVQTTSVPAHADPAMVKALARAFRWKRLLEDGCHASISEIAAAEQIDRGYVGSILRLTLLAPDIIEAILDGRQPEWLGLADLLMPFPLEWQWQRVQLLQPSQDLPAGLNNCANKLVGADPQRSPSPVSLCAPYVQRDSRSLTKRGIIDSERNCT